MKIILKQYPKEGEIACAKVNFENDLFFFSRFNKEDEEIALNNNQEYYVISKNELTQ